VSVNDTVGGTLTPGNVIFTQAFTADCVHPSATITHSCAAGGTNVDFTNAGPAAALMTVSKNGVVIDTVTVPGNGTAHRTYPMAEDETSTFRVTGLGFDSGDFVGLHDCILAESTTTLPGSTTLPDSTSVPDTVEGSNVARAATLPRTGPPSTMQLSTMAGLMLMVGGLLVALANKPAPTAATASTRSRGR
jgi:LPXTG-motif cell wall-anchored protein